MDLDSASGRHLNLAYPPNAFTGKRFLPFSQLTYLRLAVKKWLPNRRLPTGKETSTLYKLSKRHERAGNHLFSGYLRIDEEDIS
jgi:hypothetical protein